MPGKSHRTYRSESEMDAEGGGEASQRSTKSHSRRKKGHMKNIYLTDSDKEAIIDFVKVREELYDKTMRSSRTRPGRDLQAVTTSQ